MSKDLRPIRVTPDSPQAAALAKYPQDSDGYIIGLFRVFANSLRFLTGKGVVNLLDDQSPLSLREREITILRTCANNKCEYEWSVHVATFANAAKFSPDQILASTQIDADCWTPSEQLLINVIDGFCHQGKLSADLLTQFQDCWSVEQQLEIMALIGNYHTVSFVANAATLPLEPGCPTFPNHVL